MFGTVDSCTQFEQNDNIFRVREIINHWRCKLENNFVPNDPLLEKQWHLINTGQTGKRGNDVNVVPAWQSVTGKGVVIGVVDSGIDYTHPDLSPNYRPDLSFDFEDNDIDPEPSKLELPPDELSEIELEPGIENIDSVRDSHGTGTAGVAAASGSNGQGVTGVAFDAEIAGIKVESIEVDEKVARALSYKNQEIDIYNPSWGPINDGQTLEGPEPLAQAALENGVTNGRGGLGNIFVWAAGNGLETNDNVNYDGWANSRYTIAVSAIDANGKQAAYSEPGAAILVTTYSDDDDSGFDKRLEGITTTDIQGKDGYSLAEGTSVDPEGNYINNFGGTSASSPLLAGVVALMLEANPNLTWRDVQHILVNTSTQNDPSDSDWSKNGAGHPVNHKYGFGSVDATAAVDAAKTWNTVAPETYSTSGTVNIQTEIPDGQPQGVTSTLTIDKDIQIESVELIFDAEHVLRGDLEVTLTSPDGTQSVLAEQHNDAGDDYQNWTFSSVRHWGESSLGDWTLKVADKSGNKVAGVWNSAQLKVYGTENTTEPNLKSFSDTDDDNTLTGTAEDNLILSRNGNDRTFGNSGDVFYGGYSNDTLQGDRDRDELLGAVGKDSWIGEQRDILQGDRGKYILTEGDNNLLIGLEPLRSPESIGEKELFIQHLQLDSIGANTVVELDSSGNFDRDNTTLATLENLSANDLSISNL